MSNNQLIYIPSFNLYDHLQKQKQNKNTNKQQKKYGMWNITKNINNMYVSQTSAKTTSTVLSHTWENQTS